MGRRHLFGVIGLLVFAAVLVRSDVLLASTASGVTAAPSCAIYAIADKGSEGTRLLAIDLRRTIPYEVGPLQLTDSIRGLAIHPDTGRLYAVSGVPASAPGTLYIVDRATGELVSVGNTGFTNITGLAFRQTDASLWGWVNGVGLIQIDPASGAATLRFAATEPIAGIAWNNEGTVLYTAEGTTLWAYDSHDNVLRRVADNLPVGTNALDMRPDGLLMGLTQKSLGGPRRPKDILTADSYQANTPRVFAYNLATLQVVTQKSLPIGYGYEGITTFAWPRACGNPSTGGPAHMINGVILDKTQVCPGESVLVTVEATHPESPQGTVNISINGRWGSPQYVQFTGRPGVRPIHITAATPEKYVDTAQVTVEVVACDPHPEYLEVELGPNPFHDHTIDFRIANAATFNDQAPLYLWDFGDRQTGQTNVPYASHFYGAALARDQFYTNLQATITLRRPGHPDLTARKTVTLWNQYAFNKQHGFIQPPVEADQRLQVSGTHLVGAYTISNLEDEPIRFTSRQLTYQLCDPDGNSAPQHSEGVDIEVGANQTLTQHVDLSPGSFPSDVCGVEVSLVGQAARAKPTYASAYFEVQRNPITTQAVSDAAKRQLLNQIASQGWVADPLHITDEDLYRLAREGKIDYPIPPSATGAKDGRPSRPAGPADDVLGRPCHPGDTPPRLGVTCQTTGNWTVAPPHIANARKGDVILSAGCGLIGGLLRQVSPPQRYSHSGMMTNDGYQVTHSTASEERYGDHVGSDGFDPDALRYGWPGVITQSIDEAYNGEYRLDPNGKLYEIQGFSHDPVRCGSDIETVYPVVIKPVPGSDRAVRERLRNAADLAIRLSDTNANQHTLGHYRFYGYTNAAIADDRGHDAPTSAGWAAGTRGTVCSSFIWHVLTTLGIQLEGAQLEERDVALGAERDQETQDGLYLYTEAERKAGSEWLYTHMYDLAYDQAGWLGRLLTDAPDDIANQMVNCFASDGCSTDDKDSDRWKNPGMGRAVSPDNIFFWDAPSTGGVYGYNEPLVYRNGEYVAETVWQASAGNGTIAGRVLFQGQPVENASVAIAGLELFTNANGEFHDSLIPAGRYEIVASKVVDGIFLSTRVEVMINAGTTTTIELTLQPPPNYYRRVTITGSMYIVDHENIGSNETGTFQIFESRALDPFNRRADISISHCVGDEVRTELDFHLRLEEDNTSVVVNGAARLYEGTDCDTDELEDSSTFAVNLVAGGSESKAIHLRNPYALGGADTADIDFVVLNGMQTATKKEP